MARKVDVKTAHDLAPRELEVLKLICDEKSSRDQPTHEGKRFTNFDR